jgi:hypothetical protein
MLILLNSFNPTGHTEAFRVLGMGLMALGAGLLIFVAVLNLRKKPECDCGD